MGSEESLNLRERLGLLMVTCRHCQQLWLAPGLAKGDDYVCKECGDAFGGKPSVARQPLDGRPC
jgi:hypothetical protein